MKQNLYNVIFTIDNDSRSKKSISLEKVNKMRLCDYLQEYLSVRKDANYDKTDYESSLYAIFDFLQTSNKYKIYHSVDDYFTNTEQLSWLKKQTGNKSTYFSNGSHLGYLYREEFINAFKKEINLEDKTIPHKL